MVNSAFLFTFKKTLESKTLAIRHPGAPVAPISTLKKIIEIVRKKMERILVEWTRGLVTRLKAK